MSNVQEGSCCLLPPQMSNVQEGSCCLLPPQGSNTYCLLPPQESNTRDNGASKGNKDNPSTSPPLYQESSIPKRNPRWEWIGLKGKTLWDVLDLLLVPLLLLLFGTFLNLQADARQEKANQEWKNQQVMQTYLSEMKELIVTRKIKPETKNTDQTDNPETKAARTAARTAAKVLTTTTLTVIDSERKSILIKFLYDADLIQGEKPDIDLGGADLNGAKLSNIGILGKINLSRANLSKASLEGAFLKNAHLQEAQMPSANMSGARLNGAKRVFVNKSNKSKRKPRAAVVRDRT